ncbi:MAG: hypothetical protein ACE5I3_05700 [Phycisphaerae bacterium]
MKTKWIPAIVLTCATQALAEETMPWAKDYDAARTAAAASGKLIMIDFYADW